MDRSGVLERPYHVGNENCQHFAVLLWRQLSQKPYPSPGQEGEVVKGMEDVVLHPTQETEACCEDTVHLIAEAQTDKPKSTAIIQSVDLRALVEPSHYG